MNIFGKPIPFAWLEVLRTVQTAHPEAVMAGGCLRDLILGGAVKDLDIFVGPAETNLHEILTIRRGWRCNMQVNADYVASMRGEVAKVHGYIAPGLDHDVQIIQLTTLDKPQDAIERMDFAACQVGTTGLLNVWTPAAAADFKHRMITMLEPENETQEARSFQRMARFVEKYRNTNVIIRPFVAMLPA